MKRNLVTIQAKLEEIEEQGVRLRRRQEYLQRERDFLVDVMLTKPYKDMAEHRKLLAEWDREIAELGRSLEYLRGEYRKYKMSENRSDVNKNTSDLNKNTSDVK